MPPSMAAAIIDRAASVRRHRDARWGTLTGVFTDATPSPSTTPSTWTRVRGTVPGTLSVETSSEIENATVNGGGTVVDVASGQIPTLDTVTLDSVDAERAA